MFKGFCFLLGFSQNLLFNPSKPFSRGSQPADVDLMIDCLVSCFRISPHNNQHFKVRALVFIQLMFTDAVDPFFMNVKGLERWLGISQYYILMLILRPEEFFLFFKNFFFLFLFILVCVEYFSHRNNIQFFPFPL